MGLCMNLGSPFLFSLSLASILLSANSLADVAYESVALVQPHGETVFYNLPDMPDLFTKVNRAEPFVSNGITFNLMFEDVGTGFMDPVHGEAASDRLKDVLAYVAGILGYADASLDILVRQSGFIRPGVGAAAGTVFPVRPGIHPGATLHRLNTGEKLYAQLPEIELKVDFSYALATSGAPPEPGEIDLLSVLLHEITHGLGFLSIIGAGGSSTLIPGCYSSYDGFLADGAGERLIGTDNWIPYFQASISDLRDDTIGFAGLNAMAASGADLPVPIQKGSVSHWLFRGLPGTAVMVPVIDFGEMRREYAPIDLGAVIDLKNYSRGDGRPGGGPGGCVPGDNEGVTAQSAGCGVLLLLVATGLFVAPCGRIRRGQARSGHDVLQTTASGSAIDTVR